MTQVFNDGDILYAAQLTDLQQQIVDEQTARQQADAAVLAAPLTVYTRTASYRLQPADAATSQEMNVASANTVTIPAYASVPFATGTVVLIDQIGAGQTSIIADAGVTLIPASPAARAQGSALGIKCIALDTWLVFGDLA